MKRWTINFGRNSHPVHALHPESLAGVVDSHLARGDLFRPDVPLELDDIQIEAESVLIDVYRWPEDSRETYDLASRIAKRIARARGVA